VHRYKSGKGDLTTCVTECSKEELHCPEPGSRRKGSHSRAGGVIPLLRAHL